jgi:hypothetical protein
MVIVAERADWDGGSAAGSKDTFAEQLVPAAKPFAPAQLSDSRKSEAFVPPTTMLMETVEPPVLVIVNCFAGLAVPVLC